MKIPPTIVRLECKVAGCGEVFAIPVLYYLEPVFDPEVLALTPEPGGAIMHPVTRTRLRVDIEGTLAIEEPLRAHLDEHATSGAPPVEHPPSWVWFEWTDDEP